MDEAKRDLAAVPIGGLINKLKSGGRRFLPLDPKPYPK